MAEVLSNRNEQEPEPQKLTKWDELKDVPFNDGKQPENHENNQQQFETELVSPSDILSDVQSFAVKNGKVYSRETGQEETDEDTILRVKTSKFLLNKAKALRDEDSYMRGASFTDKGPDYYIDRAMDRYGFKGEDTVYAEGKLLRELVDKGSHYQRMSGDDLVNSKYGMFFGENGDLGKALLERRLKQHGLKMTDLNVGVDSSALKKDGYSTVDIKVSTTPIIKLENAPNKPDVFHHPAAEQLSTLETELIKAQNNGDDEAVKGYRAAQKMVVERNRLEVSPEDWNNMSIDQKERFYRLKMKEEKILGDSDAFNYWNANLQRLKNTS